MYERGSFSFCLKINKKRKEKRKGKKEGQEDKSRSSVLSE